MSTQTVSVSVGEVPTSSLVAAVSITFAAPLCRYRRRDPISPPLLLRGFAGFGSSAMATTDRRPERRPKLSESAGGGR